MLIELSEQFRNLWSFIGYRKIVGTIEISDNEARSFRPDRPREGRCRDRA
jgi:hypothetical protein